MIEVNVSQSLGHVWEHVFFIGVADLDAGKGYFKLLAQLSLNVTQLDLSFVSLLLSDFLFVCFKIVDLQKVTSSSSKSQHKMKRRLFLNIVVNTCSFILKLLSCKDKSLLIRRNAFLVLNHSFNFFHRHIITSIYGNSLSSQSFYKELEVGSVSSYNRS